MTSPVDAVTLDEAARILGRSRSSVRRLILAGRLASCGGRYEHRTLSRADVEALAAVVFDWRRHADDESGYWMVSHQAAALLGISAQRVRQLGDKGFLPYVQHQDGARLYRREQLLTIANARSARWR